MKHFKFMTIILTMTVALFTYTSCSKDEEETNKIEEGTGARLIKVIKDKNGNAVQLDEFGQGSHIYKYYYDASGKLNKMIEEIGGTLYKPTLVDSPFKITYNEKTKDGINANWETEINLDTDANILSYTSKETNKSESDFTQVDETVNFTYGYDNEIKMVKIEGKRTKNVNGSPETTQYNITIEFTWEKNNIVKADVVPLINNKEDRDEYKISYSSSELLSNQMPFNLVKYGILGNYVYSQQIEAFIPLIGFGKVPKNVPSYVNGKNAGAYLNSNGTIGSENSCTYKYASTK